MRVLTDELDMEKNKKKGYVRVRRSWRDGDTVQLHLDMPVKMMAAHPRVSTNSGRVALQRGPIVYCVEEVDNTKDLDAIVLPAEPVFHAQHDKKLLGGVTMLTCSATRMDLARWKGALYAPRGRDSSANAGSGTRVTLKAIPYYAWSNRKPGEMIVWLRRREGAAQTR